MKHLIQGSEYIKRFKDFKLVGRDNDLERISSILMRKSSNSMIVVGSPGVGISALILGLQASKEDKNTPFDIKNKRLFWLDTDSLFSSGDSNLINDDFHKILKRLEETPDSILVIENTFNFLEASRSSGNSHFINALNSVDRKSRVQIIMEVRDDNLTSVLKWHTDIGEHYTLYDVKEPTGELLKEIVTSVAENLSDFHKIAISEDAITEAIALTSKYRDSLGLGGAQPLRTISLLDRAFSTYRQSAHQKHPIITELEKAIEGETDSIKLQELTSSLKDNEIQWNILKANIESSYRSQRDAEDLRHEYVEQIDVIQKRNDEMKKNSEHAQEFSKKFGDGFESSEITELRAKIREVDSIREKSLNELNGFIAKANHGLCLDKKEVLKEFSKISGISADKLDADEMESLRNLETNLLSRIFGQDEVVKHVANSIKVAKIDTMEESGPAASYLMLGASGVGKTEIAKALAQYVVGDENSLVRFDMSEYMEKHAVAKLIGAPPGYEGFEAGGILTNMVRKKPVGIYLFDEIEKAHPDVFNVFLQILSDGRLTDNIGRTVDFSETIIVMTSNIGQKYYLDDKLTDEEAKGFATVELDETYRSELLNRFNGRENILHFKRLPKNIIEKIIKREISKLNKSYEVRNIVLEISDETVTEFVDAHYDPKRGARGLPGYIKANLRPIIVNHILNNPNQTGTFNVSFDKEKLTFVVGFVGQ